MEIAVDTNVLIDFADREEMVVDCFATIKRRIPGFQIIIPPTVIVELVDIADYGETSRQKKLAEKALVNLRETWKFFPVNFLPVENGIIAETARKIRAQGLIPEAEQNDSLIVAEASLRNASLLLSSDSHIKDIDPRSLKLLLDSCDLGCRCSRRLAES